MTLGTTLIIVVKRLWPQKSRIPSENQSLKSEVHDWSFSAKPNGESHAYIHVVRIFQKIEVSKLSHFGSKQYIIASEVKDGVFFEVFAFEMPSTSVKSK